MIGQGSLFDGVTIVAEHDDERLSNQLSRVKAFMLGHARFFTLDEIAEGTGSPPSSVSARLRDLRKARFGGFTVTRRRRGEAKRGLFEYRVS